MSNVSMINGHIDEPKGLTDEQIVKALECCKSFDDLRACYKCPALENGDCSKGKSYISDFILDNALDLINRLKAEKDALINGQESLMKCIAKKKEIIAELDAEVERLKKGIMLLPEVEKFANEIKSKAIKQVTAELYNSYIQYEKYDRHHTFEVLDRIDGVEEFLLKQMIGGD